MLKHHSPIMTAPGHLAPIHGDPTTARRVKSFYPQGRGLAAAGGTDQRNNLAILDCKADPVERLHMMNLAVHVQRKALGHVEESHLTHLFLQNVIQSVADRLKCLFAILWRGPAVRSSGAFKRPAFTICSWIH